MKNQKLNEMNLNEKTYLNELSKGYHKAATE